MSQRMKATRDPALAMDIIREMACRVVDGFQPEKVILFGSFARGSGGPDSDVDLLVVLPVGQPVAERAIEIRLALRGEGLAKDIFVVSSDEFEKQRDVVGSLVHPANKEGVVLYERQP